MRIFKFLGEFAIKCQGYLSNFNLFPSIPPSVDEHELKTQTISTRSFIFILILSFIILLIYNAIVPTTKTVNIQSPTLEQYLQLSFKYPQTIICPCTHKSINYEQFLRIDYTLHQMCYGSFLEIWQHYMNLIQMNIDTPLWFDDFRRIGNQYFQTLASLCKLTNETISNSLTRFYKTKYVGRVITTSELFQSQCRSFVRRYITSTVNQFLVNFRVIRDITQANRLFSGHNTNAYFYVDEQVTLAVYAVRYSNCSCAATYICAAEASVSDDTSNEKLYMIPGMYAGCYIIEALRKSTLECFYSPTCLNDLKSQLSMTLDLNGTLLDASLLTKFAANTSIGTILDELMVENWKWSSIYSDYYDSCQPLECTYTYKTRNDAIYIITSLISLLGGLIVALKFIVPRSVAIFRKRKMHAPESGTGKTKYNT